MKFFTDLLFDDCAATAVEYAVMLALIICSIITAIGTVGAQTGGMWGTTKDRLNSTAFK